MCYRDFETLRPDVSSFKLPMLLLVLLTRGPWLEKPRERGWRLSVNRVPARGWLYAQP